MILQERDIEILAFMLRYKYVSTHHIQRQVFENKSRVASHNVVKRLGKLNLLKSVHFPRMANIQVGNLLYLTDNGARTLALEWRVSIEEIGYKKVVYPIQSINHYYHRKRLIDFWIQLDNDVTNFPQLELIKTATESTRIFRNGKKIVETHISDTSGNTSLIPDIYFILQNKQSQKEALFFVEIDTGKETIGGRFKTVPENSLLSKYEKYEIILKDGHWKKFIETNTKAFQVLTVTETDKHIETMQKQCKNMVQFPQIFLNTTHKSIEDKGVLLKKNWQSFLNTEELQLLK